MKKLRHAIWFLFALLFSMNLLALSNIAALAQDEEPPPIELPYPGPFPGPITGFPPPEQKAGVVVIASIGGNTNPEPGTYNYPNGATITLTATPWVGFTFERWIISGQFDPGHNIPPTILSPFTEDNETVQTPPVVTTNYDTLVAVQNPLRIQCGYGYTYQYQPVFAPTEQTTSAGAILVMLSAVGGTTNPAAGTYTYTNDNDIILQATATSGFEFKQWVISGSLLPGHGEPAWDNNTFTTNPLSTHTPIGYKYTYQALFTPTGAGIAPSGIAIETFYIVIAALIIVIIIVAAVAVLAMRRRTK